VSRFLSLAATFVAVSIAVSGAVASLAMAAVSAPSSATPSSATPSSATPSSATKTVASDASFFFARDTADVRKSGSWSIGVFNPIEYSLSDSMAIRTNILPIARPPVVDLRWAHVTGDWRVTGEYGVALPALSLFSAIPLGVKGDLLPSCKVAGHDSSKSDSCQTSGPIIVPRIGLVVSTGKQHVTTLRIDAAYGVLLSGDRGKPLDAFPPLDLAWAAAFNGWHVRAGGRYDRLVTDSIRVSGELNLHMVGATPAPERSPWTLSAHIGADFAVGESSRFTIGVMYFNSDQRATELVEKDGYVVRESIRSNDFYPTIDFIWM